MVKLQVSLTCTAEAERRRKEEEKRPRRTGEPANRLLSHSLDAVGDEHPGRHNAKRRVKLRLRWSQDGSVGQHCSNVTNGEKPVLQESGRGPPEATRGREEEEERARLRASQYHPGGRNEYGARCVCLEILCLNVVRCRARKKTAPKAAKQQGGETGCRCGNDE